MQKNAHDILNSFLAPDETILWEGRPRQGLMFRPSDLFVIPFCLMWWLILILWGTVIMTGEVPWFFVVLCIPFVLIGLYFLIGRHWLDILYRKHSYYSITNKRAILVSGFFHYSFKSFGHEEKIDMKIRKGRSDSGSIFFGQPKPLYKLLEIMTYPRVMDLGYDQYGYACFDSVENAKDVYELLIETRKKTDNC